MKKKNAKISDGMFKHPFWQVHWMSLPSEKQMNTIKKIKEYVCVCARVAPREMKKKSDVEIICALLRTIFR